MSVFIGVGTIADVQTNGKVMNFNLSLQQEKPCVVPCLVFNPTEEIIEFVEESQATIQSVWLQGRLYCNEYMYNGKSVRKLVVVPYVKSMRAIQ